VELRQQKRSPIVIVNYALMVLLWGSFPVAAKIGVQHAPPMLISGLRFGIAFFIMAPIAYWQSKKGRIPTHDDAAPLHYVAASRKGRMWISWQQHVRVLIISLLMVGIPGCIFFAAAPFAPVGVLTIMWSTTPIFTALFAMRDRGEVHGWRVFISLVIGLIGVMIVLLGGLPFLPGSNNGPLSAGGSLAVIFELAVLASASIYGLGIRTARQHSPDIPVTVFTTWQVFYCALFLLAMSLIFERGESFQPTWTTLGALLYLAIFCSCITFFLTFWLIRRIGAIRTAYGDYMLPGVTLILSYVLLGESLTFAKIIGLALVIVSVVVVQVV
jgi:drug/metabolite transporter (DMT)-like permease